MKRIYLDLPGAWLFETTPLTDDRGVSVAFDLNSIMEGLPFQFSRWYSSSSEKGVIRGMHLAKRVRNQHKLIMCASGSVMDLLIDLRPESETFLQKFQLELNADEGKLLLVPPGVGHGFQALQNSSRMTYLISDTYDPTSEITLNPLSPEILDNWPLAHSSISRRDSSAINLSNFLAELER